MANIIKRTRLESSTTMPESNVDYESGKKLNVFASIKDMINDEIETHEKVPEIIIEESERKIGASSDDSVSDEELEEIQQVDSPHPDFSNKKLDFLFNLYDQRRACGIKPAMDYKFRPNMDIFDVDSDNPVDEPTTEPKVTVNKRALNVGDTRFRRVISNRDNAMTDDINSMKVEWGDGSSEDPDSDEIDEFEGYFKHDERFSGCLRSQPNKAQKIHNSNMRKLPEEGLRPGRPEHNHEVFEYEGQAEKESYNENSPTEKKTSILRFLKDRKEPEHQETT